MTCIESMCPAARAAWMHAESCSMQKIGMCFEALSPASSSLSSVCDSSSQLCFQRSDCLHAYTYEMIHLLARVAISVSST